MCVILQGSRWFVHIRFVRMFKFELPTQSCLVLCSFYANLFHLFVIWLMSSSLSPHNLYLLFCWVLFIPALIWLVLMALFCAAIRREYVSLFTFPFLSDVHVLSCEMLCIRRSSHFYFLVFVVVLYIVLSVSFLIAVNSPFSCFSM